MKRLNSLFKNFGSAWSSAKHYPKPLEGLPIFEPFAGGAGYSLNYHWHPVTLFETNVHVAGLWQWIINEATTQDILDIPLNVPEGTDIRTLPLADGQKLMLKQWGRTNNHGNCWTISSWHSKSGQWTNNCRARVAEQIHAVKHWKFEPITWDQAGTYVCDPPYIFNYNYGVKDFDYQKLVDNIGKVPQGSLIIASEAESKTGQIPDYLPFVSSHSQVTSRRKSTNSHHSKELVYVKYT